MKKIVFFISLLVAVPVFANEVTTCGNRHWCCKDTPEDIYKKCKDPGAYHRQIPPSHIRLVCREKCFKWERLPGVKTFEEPTVCYGKYSVKTSKKDCAKGKYSMDAAATVFSCYDYGQYKLTKATEVMMDCDEYMQVYDNLDEYCANVLAPLPEDKEPTGAVKSTCPGTPLTGGHQQN